MYYKLINSIKIFLPFSFTFFHILFNGVRSINYKYPISYTKGFAQTYYWYRLLYERLRQEKSEKSVIGDDSYGKGNIFYTTCITLRCYCANPLLYILVSSVVLISSLYMHTNDIYHYTLSIFFIMTSSIFCFLNINENYNYFGFSLYPLIIYLSDINNVFILLCSIIPVIGLTPFIFIFLFFLQKGIFISYDIFIYLFLSTVIVGLFYILTMRRSIVSLLINVLMIIGAIRIKKNNLFIRKILFRKSAFLIVFMQIIFWYFIPACTYKNYLLLIYFLYILNEFNVFRIADSKSFFNLFLIFNTLIFLNFEINLFLYVLSLNPIVYLLPLPGRPKFFPRICVISRSNVESDISMLIKNIDAEKSVFFAFKKPGDYYSIFSGMRDLLTCVNFLCSENGTKCYPDFHLLKSDPNCWVKDRDSVIALANKYDCSYILFRVDQFDFKYTFKVKLENFDFGHPSNLNKYVALAKIEND